MKIVIIGKGELAEKFKKDLKAAGVTVVSFYEINSAQAIVITENTYDKRVFAQIVQAIEDGKEVFTLGFSLDYTKMVFEAKDVLDELGIPGGNLLQ